MKWIEEIRERIADRKKLDSWQGLTRDEAMFLLSHIDAQAAEISALRAACERLSETVRYVSDHVLNHTHDSDGGVVRAIELLDTALAAASRGEGRA